MPSGSTIKITIDIEIYIQTLPFYVTSVQVNISFNIQKNLQLIKNINKKNYKT